ncbi:MAG TPA: glycosyltransferase family 1 protein [Acidimicrobiales bacterium]|nr:glycosyltransferase family 1 protein [Acidimicrobiales bacterium]
MTDGPVRVSVDVSAVPVRPAGAGTYVVELVRALQAEPEESLCLDLVARRGDKMRWESWAGSGRVHAIAPGSRPLRVAWEQLALGRELTSLTGLGVHHGPHYTMPRGARVPCVVTIHDLTFFDHPEWHERSKVPFFRSAMRHAARHAAALICVSEPTAARCREVLEPRCPVHVVELGIDHLRFRPDEDGPGADDAILGRLGVGPPYVLHVGTIEPRKDVPRLIAAFDSLAGDRSDLSLVVAGQPGWGYSAFREAVASARHRDRIVELGYVAGADIPALMRRAGAVSYASLEEGFGLPVLEALACGAPVVTTEGSVMAALADGAALLAPRHGIEGLAEAITTALDGGAQIRTLREAGLIRAASMTWGRTAALHAALYRELAGR